MDLVNFDYELFRVFNNLAGINHALDILFAVLAEAVVFVMGAGIILHGIFRKNRKAGEKMIIRAFVASFLGGLVIIPFIRLFFFRSRPFVTGIVNQLVPHNPAEASFPSTHTAVMFSLAFLVFSYDKRFGVLFIILATFSALSRIVVGVHFPLDIVGGFLVAVFVTLGMKLAVEWWGRRRNKISNS